ncbi:hypothetical protein CRUP_015959 [Coryphaenoides rupestris]|nr:hypothetical protein CRUP_015959 [Coryphaenoides rupestris]
MPRAPDRMMQVTIRVNTSIVPHNARMESPRTSSTDADFNLLTQRPTRSQAVARGTDVDLMCVNRTWTEMFYVIWNIALRHRECVINFYGGSGESENTCGDGKMLRNTSSGASYLHISDFSLHDEGLYKCEVVYNGGEDYLNTNLTLSGGKPAAAVHWRNAGNLTTPATATTQDPMDGSFTVRSSLDLPGDAAAMENLTCVVTHPSWDEELTIRPEALRPGDTAVAEGDVGAGPQGSATPSVLLHRNCSRVMSAANGGHRMSKIPIAIRHGISVVSCAEYRNSFLPLAQLIQLLHAHGGQLTRERAPLQRRTPGQRTDNQ